MTRALALTAVLVLGACAGPHETAPPAAPGSGPQSPASFSFDDGLAARLELDHVVLHTTPPADELDRRVAALLEQSVRSFIDLVPGGPEPVIEVHFFASESAWREAVQAHAQRRLGQLLPLGSGLRRAGVTIEGTGFLFDIGGEDALRLAAHEAWHAYAFHAFDPPLPLWLDEALACRAEGFYWPPDAAEPFLGAAANPSRRAHARNMVAAGRLGTLEAHLRADPAKLTHDRRAIDDYYARAWMLGLALDDPGLADRLAFALQRAARGTLPERNGDGVALILGVTPVELEARWREVGLTLGEE